MRIGIAIIAQLTVALWAHASQTTQPQTATSFMQSMIGEWIGTFNQSTDQVRADPKYFRAVVRQTGPDSYETVFRYYKLDPDTQELVDAGTERVGTTVAADGTVQNILDGQGEVLIDPETLKWEQHEFSEKLELSSPGTLQGRGTGNIVVSDTPSEEGKDGEIVDYASTWSMRDGGNGGMRITQEFQVKFKVLFFRRTYVITMEHDVRRGNNISEIIGSDDVSGAPRRDPVTQSPND